MVYQVNGSRVEWNPSPARLRELTEEMPNASVTEFGNVNARQRPKNEMRHVRSGPLLFNGLS